MTRRVHVQALVEGELTLDEEPAHYVRDVLRLAPGAAVELFDGGGMAAPGVILSVDRRAVIVRLTAAPSASTANEPALAVTLVAAIPKGDRWEWLLEKACEAGATRIIPLHTARGVVQIAPNKAADKVSRWQKILAGAARQSHRSRSPAISAPMSIKDALAEVADHTLLVPHTSGHDLSLVRAAREASGPIAAWIGPEGGWTDEEIQTLEAAGARCVHMGPRILRAETAAILACALIQAAAGDMG
jgi:16S rRNA (uracil1498-N3)-methyltransferase